MEPTKEDLLRIIQKLGRDIEAGLLDVQTFTLTKFAAEMAAELTLKKKVRLTLDS